jgi:Protein phosphatase 2C
VCRDSIRPILMTSTSERDSYTYRWLAASVRGPGHIRAGRPNDDSWLATNAGFGTLVVVCDGLGSKPRARHGSRAACAAVRDAVRHWSRAGGPELGLLLRLIHTLWAVRVWPHQAESATTCLFALARESGVLLGQLGDGIVAIRTPDGELVTVGTERPSFSNDTTGLGIAKTVDEWTTHSCSSFPSGSAVMLATDGVSDDLVQSRVADLVAHLVGAYGECPNGRLRLRRELQHWPTKGHVDDKTLALLWRPK